MKTLGYRCLVVMLACCLCAIAQQPAQTSQSQAPITVTPPSTGFAGLDRYSASRIAVYMNDYGQLARYRDADAALKPPAPGENRVVFFGDSITDIWKIDESFPGKPYVNRGIGGQTTSQMLVRFRQDVIDLQPKAVVILAGTNDIAGNTGPISNEDIEKNFSSIAELARAHNIRVIYSSILPVYNYTPQSQDFFAQRPMGRILALNKWLKDYCAANDLTYLDYFPAMIDDKGLLRRDLADDGLHPNKAGFAIMAPLAEKAIEKVLASPTAAAWEIPLIQRPEYSWLPRYMRDQSQLPQKSMFPGAPPTIRTIDCFSALNRDMTMMDLVRKCGPPDELQGSGISIYIYHLGDGSIVVVGVPNVDDKLLYAKHVASNKEVVPLLN